MVSAILVPSADLKRTEARCQAALDLRKRLLGMGHEICLVASGGVAVVDRTISDAEWMWQWFVDRGAGCMTEAESADSTENLFLTLQKLEEEQVSWDKLWIVSQPRHLRRFRLIASTLPTGVRNRIRYEPAEGEEDALMEAVLYLYALCDRRAEWALARWYRERRREQYRPLGYGYTRRLP